MGNQIRIVFEGKLPGLNEYTSACRSNPHAGAAMKKKVQKGLREQLLGYDGPTGITGAHVRFSWFEGNRRRDKDNVAFAKKFVLDSLVESKVLESDGWDGVVSFEDRFLVGDPGEERVEVEIFW